MFLALLLIKAQALTTDNCLDINCGSGITSDTCISTSDTSITVYSCKAGYFCNYDSLGTVAPWEDVQCISAAFLENPCLYESNSLPTGMPCCTDSNCLSGSCGSSSSLCSGKSTGTSCSASEECVSGSYCASGVCAKLKKPDDSCEIDLECPEGYVCSAAKCKQIFSLKVGESSTNSKACETNFLYNGVCDSIQVFINGKEANWPYSCTISITTCEYKLSSTGKTYETSDCVCSGKNSTTGYCGLYAKYSDNVIPMLSEIQYTSSICAGSPAHSTNITEMYMCGSILYDFFYKFSQFYGQYEFLNIYASGALDYCSMSLEIYDPTYTFEAYTSGVWLIASIYFLVF